VVDHVIPPSIVAGLSSLSAVIARLDRAIQYSETPRRYGEAAAYWIPAFAGYDSRRGSYAGAPDFTSL
jgi:hypothetical protein